MSAHWHIGMEVENFREIPYHCDPRPALGAKYIISEILVTPTNEVTLQFTTLRAEETDKYYPGFRAEFFRPIVKRATDISVFTALLNPSEDDIAEIELVDSVYDILDYEYLVERPFQ